LASQILHFTGTAEVALLIGVLMALVTLGSHIQTGQHHGVEMLRRLTGEALEPIAGVLVILAAAGGLSCILRDSGTAQATIGLALGAHIPPLVLAWLLAAVVRVSMGSATVAMAVAVGDSGPHGQPFRRASRGAAIDGQCRSYGASRKSIRWKLQGNQNLISKAAPTHIRFPVI
jgi:H+/gluconate symporter-like permease